ncbi:lactoylglutathione lyase [Xaviernesmea oryzae]|uniref:Lactoylglutathione lyase n=1 Tax=Xaviernesmea oryzae TaxID=464029 RepID=A0A1Q9ATD9_9HYPH|nr:VOC family protein [Xaviernesmea oryzae]OLP58697.1 lactoylglutathione lyase [Xaviernesmea oryzae]SEK68591.1 Catechol 2,3-dioxygenase [Xaviernesmea oryzae]
MQDYVTLGANDEAASNAFYDAVMETVGWGSHEAFPGWRAYSKGASGEGLILWVCKPFDGAPAAPGNGTMLGLGATSKAQVDAFHAAALAHGGSSEGAPGARPHYGPNWYSAYVRDPTGNKLSVVFNG